MIEDRLHAVPLVVQLPWGVEGDFHGVIDLVEMRGHYWPSDGLGEEWEDRDIPDEYRAQAEEWHHQLFEQLADHDEDLMEKFVHEEEPTVDELRRALRRATLDTGDQVLAPVLCGSAFKNKGVQPLLDAIVQYLPSPLDVPADPRHRPQDGRGGRAQHRRRGAVRRAGVQDHVRPLRGPADVRRACTPASLRSGSHIENSTQDRKERVGRILQMHANHREDMEAAFAGDIVALVGLKHTKTGDTLCDPAHPVVLESMTFPVPVISVAIEPKTKADQDKLSNALAKLADEDPTFIVKFNEETGQTLISGMGELHLQIIVDRLKREFNVGANEGKPQVAYRETIRKAVHEVEVRYVRQTGGRGQYGHVVIDLEPIPGGGYEFVSKIVGGVIPREYIPAVDDGIEEALESGVLAGTRWWTCAPRWSTARTTRSTRRRSRSSWPGRWRCATRRGRPTRSCSSRSCRSRS